MSLAPAPIAAVATPLAAGIPAAPRLPDWAARLQALLLAARDTPFAWGRHDCCLLAADAVLALTGHDPAAPWRSTYSDASGARIVLRQLGGLAGAAALGAVPIRTSFAGAGDIAIVKAGRRSVLAVCTGDGWLCVTRRGLMPLPLSAARHAWGVGRG